MTVRPAAPLLFVGNRVAGRAGRAGAAGGLRQQLHDALHGLAGRLRLVQLAPMARTGRRLPAATPDGANGHGSVIGSAGGGACDSERTVLHGPPPSPQAAPSAFAHAASALPSAVAELAVVDRNGK